MDLAIETSKNRAVNIQKHRDRAIRWATLALLTLMGFGNLPNGWGQDDLLITAPNRDRIERFDGHTGEYLGSFITPGSGGLRQPGGVAVGPDGNVYVTSQTSQILRYRGTDGSFLDVFAEGNGLTASNHISFHGDHMFVGQFAQGASGNVKRFNALTGDFIDNFVDVDFADGIAIKDDSIYVSNFFGGVGRYSLDDGSLIESFIDPTEGGLSSPAALLFLDNGELLVSSYFTDSVKRYSATGQYIDDAITGLARPEGLAFGPDGNLYAGSNTLGIVNKYDRNSFDFISQFADAGPTTNFFIFRTNAVPEPGSASVLIGGVVCWCLRFSAMSQRLVGLASSQTLGSSWEKGLRSSRIVCSLVANFDCCLGEEKGEGAH